MNEQRAKDVFETLCDTLKAQGISHEAQEDKLSIRFQARGEDIPLDIYIQVDAERDLIMLLSHLPFEVEQDKRIEMAVAISVINNQLVDGCFDYGLEDGHIIFRLTNSYLESEVDQDLFEYMLFLSFGTIDEYNDKLMMIAKGLLPLAKFIESELN